MEAGHSPLENSLKQPLVRAWSCIIKNDMEGFLREVEVELDVNEHLPEFDKKQVGTLLQQAANLHNGLDFIDLLLDLGADIDGRNKFGATALHLASHNGNLECARLLLKRGADANAETVCGQIALHAAINNNNLSMVRLLLEHGSDVNKNYFHYPGEAPWTPLGMVVTDSLVSNREDLALMLVEAGARITSEHVANAGRSIREMLHAAYNDARLKENAENIALNNSRARRHCL